MTSRPYAFVARPWELNKVESIDVTDAMGANIRIDARGNQVMRVLPRLNEDINEEWISDKARYAIDGLRRQRLDKPYLRGEDGRLHPASWDDAFAAIAAKMKKTKSDKMAAIAGDQVDAEAMFALKSLFDKIGSPHLDCRQDGAKLAAKNRVSYLFNTTIAGVDDADAILIIGSNPRIEAPVMNARIRRNYLNSRVPVAQIGPATDLTYPVEHLGEDMAVLESLAAGKHAFSKLMKKAKKPMVIIGMGALRRADGQAIMALCHQLAETTNMVTSDWNGFNVLHHAAARVAGLDMGFVPGKGGKDVPAILDAASKQAMELVWLLGADELDTSKLDKAFVVYQGHHGDKGAQCADVVLPGAAWAEKDGLYVNFEGRVQMARRAAFPPGDAREDWAILRAFSETINKTLSFDSLNELREQMVAAVPVFASLDEIQPAKWAKFGRAATLKPGPVEAGLDEFYMTCAISRASETMAECYQAAQADKSAVAAE